VYDFAPIFPQSQSVTMSLSRRDIENIAHLARLGLSEAEVPVYAESLNRIITLVGELDHAATEGVLPMSHPLPGLTQRLRADEVTESDQHALYQRNAAQVMAGLYLVPKVIE
jgi:aspartyl-tRNA(Asn)/glutamyl-tRNA(Gln) amidotransferase subunit C